MNILLAHDGSDHADKAMERAAEIAKNFKADVTVISVVPDICLPTAELSPAECFKVSQAFAQEFRDAMSKVAESLSSKGIEAEIIIEEGSPVEKILDTAESISADMIVLGSGGRHGAARILLGSVSSKIMELAKCDVLVVK